MSLNSYLKDRKRKKILELLLEHAGRCKSVGKSFGEVGSLIAQGNYSELSSKVAIITTQERSADDVEERLNREIALSNLPTKLGEEIQLFVRNLDRAAGAAKRSVINLELISNFKIPIKYATIIEDATKIIENIFVHMEHGLENIHDLDVVKEVYLKVNELETKVDKIYIELKRGYLEIEQVFNSAAALLILDHAFRDLEASADFAEDASDILLTLVSRRG